MDLTVCFLPCGVRDDQLLEVQYSGGELRVLGVLAAEHDVVQPEVPVHHRPQLRRLHGRGCVASPGLFEETRPHGNTHFRYEIFRATTQLQQSQKIFMEL